MVPLTSYQVETRETSYQRKGKAGGEHKIGKKIRGKKNVHIYFKLAQISWI